MSQINITINCEPHELASTLNAIAQGFASQISGVTPHFTLPAAIEAGTTGDTNDKDVVLVSTEKASTEKAKDKPARGGASAAAKREALDKKLETATTVTEIKDALVETNVEADAAALFGTEPAAADTPPAATATFEDVHKLFGARANKDKIPYKLLTDTMNSFVKECGAATVRELSGEQKAELCAKMNALTA